MIPAENRNIFINKIRSGHTILEACRLSQISKPTLYRFLKDPNFKSIFDEAIFYANSRIENAKDKTIKKNWAEMKKIALRKRD